ncbi:MAG TPA: BTAD domain-containing putative transcriptional regulator [Streptosporangiaceae bacterium]|nr:BTAD domain-containing putative transcriptional regulator [Streptosporangiaceae bacterium]
MEFRLLGPVEVCAGGGLVDAGPARQRCVLAALAADAGRVVPVEVLQERVWGGEPPQQARRSLYVYITRVRRLMELASPGQAEDARLVRRSGGYVLDVDPDQVDLHKFRRLISQSRDRTNPAGRRSALLGEAVGLWRGDALGDLAGEWPDRVRQGWAQEYIDAVGAWAQAALSSGEPGLAVGLVTELAERYPLNESLAATLMQVLTATGRSADALSHYARTQARLTEQLGADPGTELQATHQAILRGQLVVPRAEPSQAHSGPATQQPPRPGPALLPADVPAFIGRRHEVALLDAASEQATTIGIVTVSGTAGVGKSALAVHWAHRVRDKFPDGQLHINLRGFAPHGAVVEPAEAIRRVLDVFHVPQQQIPASLDGQMDLYRSMLADRRMLIILDNARDATQVRPLLPSGVGCFVVVTSRNQLAGLVATHGAHPITLDLLQTRDARGLLARRLGAGRLLGEPGATEEIITACAGLPLALVLVAARAAVQPKLSLTALASGLHDAQDRLDVLTCDEPLADVRTVFSWSYRALSPGAMRLFRLLGLHPGPDIAIPAAASLASLPLARVRPLLAELTRASLLVEHSAGRYTCHDLLRTYATELARVTDSDGERQAATHRMLDHYLHSARAATGVLYPTIAYPDYESARVQPPQPGVSPETMAGHEQALAWFTTERAVLLAAVDHAASAGLDAHAWQLVWTTRTFLSRQGHWHDYVATARAGIAAAQRLADPVAEAFSRRFLAHAYIRTRRLDEAQAHLQDSLVLSTQAGDLAGMASAHHLFGLLFQERDDYAQGVEHLQQALELFRLIGDRVQQASVLNMTGWLYTHLGQHQQACIACQQAIVLHQECNDMQGLAASWDTLGYIQHNLGDYAGAIDCYQRALALYRNQGDHTRGDRYLEADTLGHLGDAHHALCDFRAARSAWQHALAILTELGHPDAGRFTSKLEHLGQR